MSLKALVRKKLFFLFLFLFATIFCLLLFLNENVQKKQKIAILNSSHFLFEKLLSESIKVNDAPDLVAQLRRGESQDIKLFLYDQESNSLVVPNYTKTDSMRELSLNFETCLDKIKTVYFENKKVDLFCKYLEVPGHQKKFVFFQITPHLLYGTVSFVALVALLFIFALGFLWIQLARILVKHIFEPMQILENHIEQRLKSISSDPVGAWVPSKTENEIEHFYSMFNGVLDRSLKLVKLEQQNEMLRAKNSIYLQVAHDIRSPVAALNMLMSSFGGIAEDKRLIVRNATQRINDIANGLLSQGRKNVQEIKSANDTFSSEPDLVLVIALLETVMSEKRVQFRDRFGLNINTELSAGYGLFAKINATELSRVFSNLVNNAVEALGDSGSVVASVLPDQNGMIKIAFNDNGKGIPLAVLSKIGDFGFSFGKENTQSGSGLGLFHARQVMNQAGGRLSVKSEEGVGTQVEMMLPRAEPPSWFVERLLVESGDTIVIVDDDHTIHQIWQERFAKLIVEQNIKLVHLPSLVKMKEWRSENAFLKALFLVDYEFLGQESNGLEAIISLNLSKQAFLVTSRYEQRDVVALASREQIKIIPKTLAPLVPIERLKIIQPDAVLIDDDSLVHLTWNFSAKQNQRQLMCFEKPDDFFEAARGIRLSTPLFIDLHFPRGERGDSIALKCAQMGFSNIYLTTGDEPESLVIPSCVKEVLGKAPAI